MAEGAGRALPGEVVHSNANTTVVAPHQHKELRSSSIAPLCTSEKALPALHAALRRSRTQSPTPVAPSFANRLITRGGRGPLPTPVLKKYYSSTLENRPPPRRQPRSKLRLSTTKIDRRSMCHHSSSEEEWFEQVSEVSPSSDGAGKEAQPNGRSATKSAASQKKKAKNRAICAIS